MVFVKIEIEILVEEEQCRSNENGVHLGDFTFAHVRNDQLVGYFGRNQTKSDDVQTQMVHEHGRRGLGVDEHGETVHQENGNDWRQNGRVLDTGKKENIRS